MTETETQNRVCATVNLGAIRHNLDLMYHLDHIHKTPLCAVLKADAYGHGAVPIARMLEKEETVCAYAVATAREGVELREKAHVKKPVMILGYAFPESDEALFAHDIEPSVFREDTLRSLEDTAKRTGAVKKLRVHVPLDTGMGRIGITDDDRGIAFIKRLLQSDALELHGLFTHFSSADETDDAFTAEQCRRFDAFVKRIHSETGVSVPVLHTDNSAAILSGRGAPYDMVRAGIAMYGLSPSEEIRSLFPRATQLRPALKLTSHISFVKEVPAGTPVSYGRTFVTTRPSVIATVPVGYADGYPRQLSSVAHVIVRGRKAPVAGRVCMDQFMIDVTEIADVREGDEVILISDEPSSGQDAVSLGRLSGRFHYELLCCINKRVPRIYTDGE